MLLIARRPSRRAHLCRACNKVANLGFRQDAQSIAFLNAMISPPHSPPRAPTLVAHGLSLRGLLASSNSTGCSWSGSQCRSSELANVNERVLLAVISFDETEAAIIIPKFHFSF
jgi:hypothetical protein